MVAPREGATLDYSDLIDSVLHDTHRIVRLIGEGGMGAVFEAVHVKLYKKRFAVKVLHAKMAENDTIYARFQREAMITSELGHPHIVEVLDFYETDQGQPCMVMEYLEGEDLGQRLEQGVRMTPDQVMALMEQVGSALQAVHDKGIVHRDMKPGNILLVGSRSNPILAKVLDFGISKIQDANTHLTSDNAVMGTPHYMSPEQGEGHVKEVDHRTDIFALGTICYHALSGVLPFSAPSMLGVLRAICDKPHDPIKVHLPELGDELDRVLNRALAKRKQDRYSRVEDFVIELGAALDGKKAPLQSVATTVDRDSAGGANEEVGRQTLPAVELPDDDAPQQAPQAAPLPVTMVTSDGGNPNMTNLMGMEEALNGRPAADEPAVDEPAAVSTKTTLSGSAGETTLQTPPARKGKPLWQVGAAVAVGLLAPLGVFLIIQNLGSSSEVSSARVTPLATAAPSNESKPAPSPKVAVKTPAGSTATSAVPSNVAPPAAVASPKTEAPAPAPVKAEPPIDPTATPRPDPVAALKKRTETQSIEVKLVHNPASARVTVDGKEHRDNPLELKASKRRRRLVFKAEGYRTKKLRKVLRMSQTIQVRLKRKPRGDGPPFGDLSPEPAKKPAKKPKKDKAPFDDI